MRTSGESETMLDWIFRMVKERPLLLIAAVGMLVIVVLLLPRIIWILDLDLIHSYAGSYTDELRRYVSINDALAKSVTYAIFVVFVFIFGFIFSMRSKRRRYGVLLFAGFSILFYGFLGVVGWNVNFDPVTSAPKKCVVFFNGRPKLIDIIPGAERQIDTSTGLPCKPVTSEEMVKYERQQLGVEVNRIPEDVMPEMFDTILGVAKVYYYRSADGQLELFDAEGNHPFTNELLKPVTSEIAREWEEHVRQIKEKRDAEEQRIREQQAAEEQEFRALAEAAERERQQYERQLEQAGQDCDMLAGNGFDRFKNASFPSVSFKLLGANAVNAITACKQASEVDPSTPRYRYQLARSLHASRSVEAKAKLLELTRQNYPAAYDNVGWIFVDEGRVAEGITYFEHGASLGSTEAKVSLAGFLVDGRWVRRDERRAYELLREAADEGHSDAIEAVRKYESRRRAGELGGAILGLALREMLKKK